MRQCARERNHGHQAGGGGANDAQGGLPRDVSKADLEDRRVIARRGRKAGEAGAPEDGAEGGEIGLDQVACWHVGAATAFIGVIYLLSFLSD